MSDHVTLPGTGQVISADLMPDGSKAQQVKVILGADGVNGGLVTQGNPFPVGGTALGAPADAEAAGDGSIIGLLKRLRTLMDGVLTDAELRASAVPVSVAALPLPNNAATEATLAALDAKIPALGQAAMAGSQPVVIASNQSAVPVNQAGVSASGSLAALSASLALSLNGATGFAVDLRGTFVGTVTFQGTIDGTNWFTVLMLPISSGVATASVSAATAVGAWAGSATGMQQVRAIFTAYTSGTVNVTLRAMQAAGVVLSLPSGSTNAPMSLQYPTSATGSASVLAVMSPSTAPAPLAVKASAGRLLGVVLQNSSASVRSVKFWNVLVAGVTIGTTSALFEIDIPAGLAITFNFEGGIGFATGITYAVTGAKGLLDTTAVGANDVTGVIMFA